MAACDEQLTMEDGQGGWLQGDGGSDAGGKMCITHGSKLRTTARLAPSVGWNSQGFVAGHPTV